MTADASQKAQRSRLPIRVRLTAWYAVSLTALIALFGLLIHGLMSDRLLTRTDAELDEELHELQLETEIADGREALCQQLELRFGHHDTFDFVVQNPVGECVFSSRRILDAPAVLPLTRADGSSPHRSAELRGIGPARIGVREVRSSEGPMHIAVVAPLSRYISELSDLRWLLVTVGPMIVLIAIGGGWWLARRSLRPVDLMTAAAERITAEHRSERLIPDHSGDELGRLASTLNAMIDRLQRSLDDTRQFTADAAHELRTPLAVIRSTAEVALRSPRTTAGYEECLQTVLEETARMTALANQLLMLAREEAGLHDEPLRPVDLADVARDAINDLEPLAELKGLSLTMDCDSAARVPADRDRLRRVLLNLLDNAIKHTPAGGQVSLTIEARVDVAQLIIRDTGIGIPPEHLPHVFERFYRADASHNRETGGVGLGLAICRAIIKSHQGAITIRSTPGEGTEVRIGLPLCPTPLDAVPSIHFHPSSRIGSRISSR